MLLIRLSKKFQKEPTNRKGKTMTNKQTKETNAQSKNPYVIFVEGNETQPKKMVTKVKDLIRKEVTDLIKQEFAIFEKDNFLYKNYTFDHAVLNETISGLPREKKTASGVCYLINHSDFDNVNGVIDAAINEYANIFYVPELQMKNFNHPKKKHLFVNNRTILRNPDSRTVVMKLQLGFAPADTPNWENDHFLITFCGNLK